MKELRSLLAHPVALVVLAFAFASLLAGLLQSVGYMVTLFIDTVGNHENGSDRLTFHLLSGQVSVGQLLPAAIALLLLILLAPWLLSLERRRTDEGSDQG